MTHRTMLLSFVFLPACNPVGSLGEISQSGSGSGSGSGTGETSESTASSGTSDASGTTSTADGTSESTGIIDGSSSTEGPASTCGNDILDDDEQCDDGNAVAGDGCSPHCNDEAAILQLTSGAALHTCVLLEGGRVRCWGVNDLGQLGLGHTERIGDDELPANAPDVQLPGPAIAIAAGNLTTCAVLEGGELVCWGWGASLLGYQNDDAVGDDELPIDVGTIDVGAPVEQVAPGGGATCVLTETGSVRCWGFGGLHGYGHLEDLGDDEPPSAAGDLDVGGPVQQIATCGDSACALMATGSVRCWGQNVNGESGYDPAITTFIGDDEVPADVGDIDLGGTAVELRAGASHMCVLMASGGVRCWGQNHSSVGYPGDNIPWQSPAQRGDIDVGDDVAHIAAGHSHTCAILAGGGIRCWGIGGLLGHGRIRNIGDNEHPASLAPLDFGSPAGQIGCMSAHSCTVLDSGAVRCWGTNEYGSLGYGHTESMLDAALVPDVAVL